MTTLATVLSAFGVSVAPADVVPAVVKTKAGRADFARLTAQLGFTRGAEIGVWKGKWSAHLCKHNPALHMLCVDRWATYPEYGDSRNRADALEAAHAEAVRVLSAYRCTILREASVTAAAQVPDGSLDFVYIDANHGEAFVRQDLEAWAPKVRAGGLISGHDYLWRPERPYIEVKAAVDRFVASRRIRPVFVLAGDLIPSFAWVQP